MRATIRKFGDDNFEIPSGISQAWVDKKSGRKVAPNSPGAILESFAEMPEMGTEDGSAAKVARPLGDDEYFENQ
jgi:hypothetical protein